MAYLSVISKNPHYAMGNADQANRPGSGSYHEGATIFGIPNRDLSWEKTETYNIGFEGQTSTGNGDEVQMIELQFGNETWQVTNIGDSTFSYKTSPNTTNQTLYFVIEITAIN